MLGRSDEPTTDKNIKQGSEDVKLRTKTTVQIGKLKQSQSGLIVDNLEDKILTDPYKNFELMNPNQNDHIDDPKDSSFIYQKLYEPNKKRLDIISKSSSMARSRFILKNRPKVELQVI